MKLFNLLVAIVLLATPVYAQKMSINGKVTDAQNQALVGVNVIIKDSTTGTVTDESGLFSLTDLEAKEYTLQFSYVGFEMTEQVIKATNAKNLVVIKMAPEAVNLEQLYVTATRAGEDSPFAYTNVDEEEIAERNLGQDIPFLLRYTPSAVVSSDAGTGIGYTGIRIRGVEPTGINVTINGIPLNDSESQGVFWVNMPDFASSTGSVQVQRGVGTSTNGAGAFGASINLSTDASEPEAFTSLAASVGSFGTRKGNVEFGTGMLGNNNESGRGLSFSGRVSQIVSDGYIDRASVDLNSYFLNGTYHGKNSTLRFNHFAGHEITYQAWNGVPVQWGEDEELRKFNSAGTQKPGEPHENEVDNYRQQHYQLLYSRSLAPSWDLSLAGHYTRGFGFFELYEGGADFAEFGLTPIEIDSTVINTTDLIQRRWLDNDFYGVTYNVSYRGENLQNVIGGAWNTYSGDHFGEVIWARFASSSEQGDRYYDNVGEKTDFNIYNKTNFQIGSALNAFVDLQYRKIDYSIEGIDNDGRDITQSHTYNFFNPKAGLSLDLNNDLRAYASFSVGNREPNRGDFTDAGDADNDGQKDVPLHETLYDTEIGVRKAWKKAAIQANVYYMDYKNALIPTGELNDVGATIRTNVEDAYRAGIELVGGVRLTDFLEVNADVTLSQNRVSAFTEFIDNWDTWAQETVEHTDTDLALSPQIIHGGEITVHALPSSTNQSLTFSLLEKFVGKQFLDNTSNEDAALPSYWFADFRVSYSVKPKKIAEEISLNLLVRNITGAQFSTAGWVYRFRSPSYNPIADDPYSRTESRDNQYNLTGLYPQAGTNFLLGLNVRF